jgi:hypothetical protein
MKPVSSRARSTTITFRWRTRSWRLRLSNTQHFSPEREQVQKDGRIRRWARIEDVESGKYLGVVLLSDRETVHNAFFDRGYKP